MDRPGNNQTHHRTLWRKTMQHKINGSPLTQITTPEETATVISAQNKIAFATATRQEHAYV